jgi:Fe-S-cluster containining protein
LKRRETAFETTPRPDSSDDCREESIEESRALAFFARRWPCVFLADDGSCSIHGLRPYSCRRFFSLSDPELCTAEGVVRREYRGFFFEPSAHVDRAMAELDGVLDFDAGTERLDKALLAWWNRS